MLGYEERVSILQGAEAVIFDMVCERSTPEQWAEWLRVPLEHAAGKGDVDLVGKLMKAGVDGSAGWKGCEGKSLLHAAAEGGNEQVMSVLMRAGAKEDINTTALAKRRTPLHVAALGGKAAAAEVLMLGGADVNALDAGKEGPLHLAIEGGHAGVVRDLLLRGANPNVKGDDGDFPIHLAAGRGQDGVLRTLLHAGAQVDRLSDDGWTPLVIAVLGNHLSTVKVLLDGGANTAIICRGDAPLHKAARRSNTDILEALVEAGAGIEARNGKGLTVLHSAAYFGSCPAMGALLRLGADVHVPGTVTGCTPLHIACQQVRPDAADLLLRWGADETTVDRYGDTPAVDIPNITEVAGQDHPRLERLSKLLASAPQDRAWRRRGMLVMCRAHPDRLRLAVEISDTAEASEQPQGRPSRRARGRQVKVEVMMGGAQGGRAESTAGSGRRDRAAVAAVVEGSMVW